MHLVKSQHPYYTKWHIQRPDRFNGLGPSIGQEIWDGLTELQNLNLRADNIRMLAITAETRHTSRGPIWIAGGDLQELAQLSSREEAESYANLYQKIVAGLRSLPIPVVMLIEGQTIGGGIEFALGADIRIARSTASFHFKQTAVGLATGYGGSTYLKELVGDSRARAWLLLNRHLTCQEAYQQGLIHQIVDLEDGSDSILNKLAETFAQQSPEGLAAQKKMLLTDPSHLEANLKRERELFGEIWLNPVHRKFLERYQSRKP